MARPSPALAGRRALGAGLVTLLVALVVAVVGAAAVGHLAYGVDPVREGRLTLDGLSAPVEIGWAESGLTTVDAQSEADLASGLGYVHAADHAWAMALWRQAALGELAAWFPEREGLDRHARTLGFSALARQTYAALPPADRAPLDAYARGANLALGEASVAQRDEFVLLDVEPERWAPWHALAVERLMAWLATPALQSDTAFAAAARADTSLAAFATADSTFRAFLGLGGTAASQAWVAPLVPAAGGETQPTFVQQLAYGASALPLVREVALGLGGRRTLAATVPGTLALPSGQADGRAWSVFLTATLTVAPDDGPPPLPRFERLVDRSGNETLLRITRAPEGLYVPAAPRPTPPPPRPAPAVDTSRLAPDSSARPAAPARPPVRPASFAQTPPPASNRPRQVPTAPPLPAAPVRVDSVAAAPLPEGPRGWRIGWTGFEVGSDLGAWRALFAGRAPAFVLLRGDGLVVTPGGAATVLGAPPVSRELPGGVFVGGSALASYAAGRLAGLLERAAGDSTSGARRNLSPDALTRDAYSAWAAGLAPRLIGSLGPRDAPGDSLGDAVAFLRGWDFRYDPSSIGASVFETWLATIRRTEGALPDLGRVDSAAAVARTTLLRRALTQAVDSLTRRHGERAGGWRWEAVQPGALVFPVWASGDTDAAPARYAPVTPGPGGHPTTLLVGPALALPGLPMPGVWTAWSTPGEPSRLVVRHRTVSTSGFLARSRSALDRSEPHALRRDARPERLLTLRPPARRDGGSGSD